MTNNYIVIISLQFMGDCDIPTTERDIRHYSSSLLTGLATRPHLVLNIGWSRQSFSVFGESDNFVKCGKSLLGFGQSDSRFYFMEICFVDSAQSSE